mmetsp:Transcript_19972/g.42636  ORF Transcript_19972/g.42636 Transcript_19972/m.42636 type:complete len:312 (-) Transcript_19972:81-1016(-)
MGLPRTPPVAGTSEPPSFPPEAGYRPACDGWQASQQSEDWLYKPSSGIYFHTPTETLWKRAVKGSQRYVRVDLANLESLTVAAFGTAMAGARALLKACFENWRKEICKFEEMERDLTLGCEEARMPSHPHTSAPRACERWSEPGDSGFPQFLRLFSWLPQRSTQNNTGSEPAHSGRESKPEKATAALTPAALVRHNMQPPPQRVGAAPTFAAGERNRMGEAIALVHRDREGGWRRHIRDGNGQNFIDESYRLKEGDEVIFDVGRQEGVVYRCFPELDEYSVSVGGKVVCTESGKARYFKADDLTLASERSG